MWFLLFGLGAVTLLRVRLPAALTSLPYPPPMEARFALYFLVAALLRLAIRDARVRAIERKARRAAPSRPGPFDLQPPRLLEVSAGVGKGVAEVVLGDIMGATLAAAALLLRVAASRRVDPRTAAVRAAERKRLTAREARRALVCIVAVGLLCAALTWYPILRPRAVLLIAALRQRLPL